jgi:hypothetical protein
LTIQSSPQNSKKVFIQLEIVINRLLVQSITLGFTKI